MKIFLPIIAVLLLVSITQCTDRPIKIVRGDVEVESNPDKLTNAFPEKTIFPGARVKYSALFRTQEFWAQPQSMASLESPSTIGEIEQYYRDYIDNENWKIIQSRKEPNSILIMAESDYRKLMTVIIRQGDPLTSIRIYFKRSGS